MIEGCINFITLGNSTLDLQPMKKIFTLLLYFVLQATCAQVQTPAFIRDSLDAYVNRALRQWQIPGAAVGIVKDGQVVLLRGYGVRELGAPDKVDEHTLFMIGSNTKAFTATALAQLEADGKLSLNDPVQKWLPDFKLYDSWVTKEANIKDLLCHRLGFETFQGDFMFFDSDLTTAQVRTNFGKLKPLYGFRSKWGYTNAAFLTAGEIIPKVTGKSWSDDMQERIFKPLDMNRTLALSRDIEGATNKAKAHTVVQGKLKQVPYGKIDAMAPAGSISSSVRDLSHWVMMQLDTGRYNGQVVVAKSAIMKTRQPASILGDGGHMFNKAHFALYGLGWFLEEYEGRKIVAHTGGVNGFLTSICLVPEERLGIIVLTNTDANGFFEALRNEIEDAYLGLPYRNYSSAFLQNQKANDARMEKMLQAKRDTINMGLKPDVALKLFAGVYEHPIYGKMTIAQEGEKNLKATFEHHKGRHAILESLGKNRFLATFNDPLYGVKAWPFQVAGGKVKSVTVRVADFVEFTPYEFLKIE
jgi:CubicO group peptidase (beta-lactamase class C family)